MNCKSFLIALALVQRHISVQEAAMAARVETLAQMKQWGLVEDTHDVEEAELERQLGSVVAVLLLWVSYPWIPPSAYVLLLLSCGPVHRSV